MRPTRWRWRSATPTARRWRPHWRRRRDRGRPPAVPWGPVMIALLSGEGAVRRADHVVVSCGGVGYRLAVSAETLRQVPRVGDAATLHTHRIVRDDAVLLYAF